jgi:membrane-bound lytic murein transglycosylase D
MIMKSCFSSTILTIIVFMLPCLSLSQVKRTGTAIDTDFPLPDKATLCGEAMPLTDTWAWEMLDRELTITIWNKEQTFMYIKRAGRYFPYLEKKLAQNNMPDDLKYLVVAESALMPSAKSTQGAVGLWQFMIDTGKKYGLKSDKYLDERRGIDEATDAALSYLKKLKDRFGTWSLALAAYNCGENRVQKEIKDQQENSFYDLKLPVETERYIFRIAAIKIVMENPETYGYQVPAIKIYSPVKCDTINVNIKKSMHITDFAKAIGTTFKIIRDLNPQIIDDYLPAGTYNLDIPAGTTAKAQEALRSHSSKVSSISDKYSSKYYVVQQGDTLTGISKKTGVSLDRLIEINSIDGSVIKVGDVLSLE